MFSPIIPRKIKFSQLKIGQRYKDHLENNSTNRIVRISRKGKTIIKVCHDDDSNDKGFIFSLGIVKYDCDVYIVEE